MAQYLIAQWDYTAEGNYELSFKEGDKIKLLEKHNDDWYKNMQFIHSLCDSSSDLFDLYTLGGKVLSIELTCLIMTFGVYV